MPYARTNNANKARIIRSNIFASGTFKNVWQGACTEGQRKGEQCVAKEFKTGSVFEDHYFDAKLEIIRHTQTIINDFHANGIINKKILLNTPDIWTYEQIRQKALIEPMIGNLEKFNSNTGWADVTGGAWIQAMQALNHFSYHDANRQFLLCDLHGGAYSDGNILSNQVIMSQAQHCGPADLGPDGINSF